MGVGELLALFSDVVFEFRRLEVGVHITEDTEEARAAKRREEGALIFNYKYQ